MSFVTDDMRQAFEREREAWIAGQVARRRRLKLAHLAVVVARQVLENAIGDRRIRDIPEAAANLERAQARLMVEAREIPSTANARLLALAESLDEASDAHEKSAQRKRN